MASKNMGIHKAFLSLIVFIVLSISAYGATTDLLPVHGYSIVGANNQLLTGENNYTFQIRNSTGSQILFENKLLNTTFYGQWFTDLNVSNITGSVWNQELILNITINGQQLEEEQSIGAVPVALFAEYTDTENLKTDFYTETEVDNLISAINDTNITSFTITRSGDVIFFNITQSNGENFYKNFTITNSTGGSNCNSLGSCGNITYLNYQNIGNLNLTGDISVDNYLANTLGFTLTEAGDNLRMTSNVGGSNYWEFGTSGSFMSIYANPNPSNGYLMWTVQETQGDVNVLNIYEGGTGHNRFWDSGSMRIGGREGYLCSELTTDVDCNTPVTGADLVVQDDIWIGGQYKANTTDGWGNVTITESQISDLTHTIDTNISVTNFTITRTGNIVFVNLTQDNGQNFYRNFTDNTSSGGSSEWTRSGSLLYPNTPTTTSVLVGGTTASGSDIVLNSTGTGIFNNSLGVGVYDPITKLDVNRGGSLAVLMSLNSGVVATFRDTSTSASNAYLQLLGGKTGLRGIYFGNSSTSSNAYLVYGGAGGDVTFSLEEDLDGQFTFTTDTTTNTGALSTLILNRDYVTGDANADFGSGVQFQTDGTARGDVFGLRGTGATDGNIVFNIRDAGSGKRIMEVFGGTPSVGISNWGVSGLSEGSAVLNVNSNIASVGHPTIRSHQDSTTGAIETLELQQDDIDKPFIDFVSTAGQTCGSTILDARFVTMTAQDYYALMNTPIGNLYYRFYVCS